MRSLVRRLVPAEAHAPSLLRALFSPAYRHLRKVERKVRAATNARIASGPFRGIDYISRAIGSVLSAKLLGTYEKELWPMIDQIMDTDYQTIVDIGAAEGYYAIGMAKRKPAAHVIAFEARVDQHPLLEEIAMKNGVRGQIELHGACTVENLATALPAGRALVICDVEGFERELLDPSRVSALLHADMLVELHDFAVPGIAALLRERFGASHEVMQIDSRPRTPTDWPEGIDVEDSLRATAMNEGRPGTMHWFWMQARSVKPVR